MLEVNVPVPGHLADESIPGVVEQICNHQGLKLSRKGTLSKYPGCVHWHYRKDKQRGTLEITWWGKKRRLWIKVAARRSADWIQGAIALFKDHFGKYNSKDHVRLPWSPGQ